MARKAVTLNAFMKRVQAQIYLRNERTRAGRATRDYRDGKLAQTVITFSTEDEIDALREKLKRFLRPNFYKRTGVRHLDRDQQRWLLRILVEAYYTEGYYDLVRMGIDDAIEELVARRVVPEPWSDEYKGTGLYSGQVGSEEKAQEKRAKALEANNATKRAKAIEARENNLDGGAAAPGLSHRASGNRQKTRGSDRVAREKKVAPPKARDEAAFRRKHRPEAEGCCDDCERPLAPSIYSPGQRRPVEREHQKGGRHAGRLRACLTVDVGCNQGKRAEIDVYNDMLERAGEDPMTAEESAMLCKIQLARLGRLPSDDPHADEIMRFLKRSERIAANARWPAVDDAQAAPSTTRSDRDVGEARVAALALERERRAAKPSGGRKARAAYFAKERKEAAATKAKHEARLAAMREKYHAEKGKPRAPPAFRRFALPPAPAPRGPRKRVAVEPYDPAELAAKPQSAPGPREYAVRRAKAKAKAKEKAKRAALPAAKPGKRARR